MQPSRPPSIPLRFGPFEVDFAASELRKRGRKVPLQDQPFKVLTLLLQSPGEVVTREELQRALWPSDSFGEFDEGLNKAIQKLRQALDDSTDNPRFIETVPRKGYRFVAEVESVADVAVAQVPQDAPARRWSREIFAWVLFSIAFLAALTLGIAYLRQPRSEAYTVRVQIPVFGDVQLYDYPVVAPNGRRVVFVGDGSDGRRRLWIRPLGSLTTQALPGTEGVDNLVFWSPDSQFVGFWVGEYTKGKLKKVDVVGGLPVDLCETTATVWGGTWSRDGVILFSQVVGAGSRLYSVSAAGGEAKPVPQPDKLPPENDMPQFLPDGRHFLYRSGTKAWRAENGGIYLGSLDSKETTLLISRASNAIYSPPGFLIYGRQESLLAQPFDAEKLRLTGAPFPIAEQVARDRDDNYSLFSASDNGVLAYRNAGVDNVQLAWYGRDGGRQGSIAEPAKYGIISIAPDETRLAVRKWNAGGTADIWTLELSNGILTRATVHSADNLFPVWSPDGRQLAFSSNRKGRLDLYRKVVGGDEEELLFASNDEDKLAGQWLADGSVLFFAENSAGRAFYRLPLTGQRKPIPLLKSKFAIRCPVVSSDGGRVAYQSNETGREEVYVAAFPTFMEKRQVSNGGGYQHLWRKDGNELFYLNREGKLMSVDVKRGVRLETGLPRVLFQAPDRSPWVGPAHYCVTGDGKRFILPEPVEERSKPFTVVLNWTADLKR
jgi:DNA-binding winged helix-turn-helix (wHTH) protein/Tol biopolymer transport system component